MGRTKKAVVYSSLGLGAVFLILMSFASSGYGYMGYNGYGHGPSFWYWGGPNVYHGRDVRNGSVSGSGGFGGGPGAGK